MTSRHEHRKQKYLQRVAGMTGDGKSADGNDAPNSGPRQLKRLVTTSGVR